MRPNDKGTVFDYMHRVLAVCWTGDEHPEAIRLAAAVEYGCYATLVDIGLLDDTSNYKNIDGLEIERTDLKCIGLLDMALEREERKQLNRDALLLEDDGFHGLEGKDMRPTSDCCNAPVQEHRPDDTHARCTACGEMALIEREAE